MFSRIQGLRCVKALSLAAFFLGEICYYFRLTAKYNASVRTNADIEKMKYLLLRETHVIEKGLSLRSPRTGFGQEKVLNLLDHLKGYASLYGDNDMSFVGPPLSTIARYVSYMKDSGVAISEIERQFSDLCSLFRVSNKENDGGVVSVSKDLILSGGKGSFDELLRSRHSIRYFDNLQIPSDELIIKALQLAQLTPSACNRQAWKTHVFRDRQSVDLAKWQGGCRGFEDEIQNSILVTADLKGFLFHEVHQAYIDGGLFAMNLINSLHHVGFGTVPLSTGFDRKKLRQLGKFGIPNNEVPILIIGFGILLPDFKVAVSKRKSVSQTNVFH